MASRAGGVRQQQPSAGRKVAAGAAVGALVLLWLQYVVVGPVKGPDARAPQQALSPEPLQSPRPADDRQVEPAQPLPKPRPAGAEAEAEVVCTHTPRRPPPESPSELPATCQLPGSGAFQNFLMRYLRGRQPRRLVYSCESHKLKHWCGGVGDRLRGVIHTFFLAMASGRRFQIYSPYPAPLYTFYQPNYVDWAVTDESSVAGIPSSLLMMREKGHSAFMRMLADPSNDGKDIRAQSNSFDATYFALRSARLRRSIEHDMGLRDCNISCYYACLHSLLFTPNSRAQRLIDQTVEGRGEFLSMQVRVSGSWAPLRIPEKWRTHPEALPHFWSAVDDILAQPGRQEWGLFVTTDAPRLLALARDRYGARVFNTTADQFHHTDTQMLDRMRPDKYAAVDSPLSNQRKFETTLLNNHVLGMGRHMLMAQSGFGDTAFWRTRGRATCLFVDIEGGYRRGYRKLWKHRLVYGGGAFTSVQKVGNAIIAVPPPADLTVGAVQTRPPRQRDGTDSPSVAPAGVCDGR